MRQAQKWLSAKAGRRMFAISDNRRCRACHTLALLRSVRQSHRFSSTPNSSNRRTRWRTYKAYQQSRRRLETTIRPSPPHRPERRSRRGANSNPVQTPSRRSSFPRPTEQWSNETRLRYQAQLTLLLQETKDCMLRLRKQQDRALPAANPAHFQSPRFQPEQWWPGADDLPDDGR